MIAADRPFSSASRKNAELICSLMGRPKEMLDTPSTVFPPSSSLTRFTVSRVVMAPFLSELTAMHKASTRISFFSIP